VASRWSPVREVCSSPLVRLLAKPAGKAPFWRVCSGWPIPGRLPNTCWPPLMAKVNTKTAEGSTVPARNVSGFALHCPKRRNTPSQIHRLGLYSAKRVECAQLAAALESQRHLKAPASRDEPVAQTSQSAVLQASKPAPAACWNGLPIWAPALREPLKRFSVHGGPSRNETP